MSMTAQQLTDVIGGVSASDTFFYVAGGGILLVSVGQWGFVKIRNLLFDNGQPGKRNIYDSDEFRNYSKERNRQEKMQDLRNRYDYSRSFNDTGSNFKNRRFN